MRICFVDPRGIHFGLNTGIGYLASYLKKVKHSAHIKVFDFNNNLKNVDARIKEIAGYDIIGFSIKSFTKDSAIEIARQVKTPHNILIAGGPHITLDGVNFIKEYDIFDFGVAGEGELTLAALLNALELNTNIKTVKGIIYRSDNEVISTGSAGRTTDLDDIPYPDYNVFDSIMGGKIYNYPLVTSRGCPYPCTYCCVKDVMGKKWLARSVENIVGELKEAQRLYKISCFNIQDDNFSLDMKRAKEFCGSLVENAVTIKWSCPNGIRADRIDDELMEKMRRAGCFAVAMGIESGVEEEFRAIKKGESLDDIIKAIKLAKKNNIWVFGNFIIGLPHSNLESIRKSVRFARRLDLESCIFNLLVPFPGTEVWGWVNNNGRLLMDWKKGFTQGKNPRVVFETDEFPKGARIRAYWEANIKCKNYFACIDEHNSLMANVLRVLKNIAIYDFWGIPGHIVWCLKHFKRIVARAMVVEENI